MDELDLQELRTHFVAAISFVLRGAEEAGLSAEDMAGMLENISQEIRDIASTIDVKEV